MFSLQFRVGYNTDTYKFYADFDAKYGLGYLFCDAGWSTITNLFEFTPGLDIREVVRDAHERGIGVVLWTSSVAMETQAEAALDQFAKWNVQGIMVDFMDRDDQKMRL